MDKVKFVTVSIDYLQKLHQVDSEVFFSSENNYEDKPHMGMLVNNEGYDYVIPLTSAKVKHKKWKNVTDTNYIIFEMIHKDICKEKDVIVSIKNTDNVKRLISVLEIKKMIPVKEGLYRMIDFSTFDITNEEQRKRKALLEKEYRFCLKIKEDVLRKANKIYNDQIEKEKVYQFHCNYKKLEEVCRNYKV